MVQSATPDRKRSGLASFPFARRYLGNHCYFLFLRVLRCFSSPGSPTGDAPVWRDRSRRVSPFGHPRVAGHLPLTAAFRSLSRPSSPPRATGIPHAPLFSFLSPFKRHAHCTSPTQGDAERPRLLDLGRCRSISLSTRFLASIRGPAPPTRARPENGPHGAETSLSNFSSRSQHVNDLILVEDNGLEPLTPCLQSRCSTS